MKKLGPEKKSPDNRIVQIIDVRLYTIQGAGATSETISTETSCFWLIEVLFNQRSKPFKKVWSFKRSIDRAEENHFQSKVG